jgi:hypothetical protein
MVQKTPAQRTGKSSTQYLIPVTFAAEGSSRKKLRRMQFAGIRRHVFFNEEEVK